MFSNEFLEVFQYIIFCSTPPAVTSGRYQSVVFITNFKKRSTVLLISLLFIWNICYAKIKESRNKYCFILKAFLLNLERNVEKLSSTSIDLCYRSNNFDK